MKTRELMDFMDRVDKEDLDNLDVVIEVESPKGSIRGGLETVRVKSIGFGFDWNSGQLIIFPEELLEKKK
jgi:hypothetical protein